jgi:hypothetical protein
MVVMPLPFAERGVRASRGEAPGVKIAVSSAPFRAAFAAGTLTHLEWVEGCASRLDADGIVLALGDLPRSDAEYAAQVRKVALDLGLVSVALDAPGLLVPDAAPAQLDAALALATQLGAGIICTTTGPAGDLPPKTFVETVTAAKRFAALAKAANVTVAVAPADGAAAPDPSAVRHLLKDVDSAWLRLALPADADRSELSPRERVLLERIALDGPLHPPPARRGWFVVEGDGGADPFARVGAAVAALRA